MSDFLWYSLYIAAVEQIYFSPYNDQADHGESKKKIIYFKNWRMEAVSVILLSNVSS